MEIEAINEDTIYSRAKSEACSRVAPQHKKCRGHTNVFGRRIDCHCVCHSVKRKEERAA